jgi:hypothetical protein
MTWVNYVRTLRDRDEETPVRTITDSWECSCEPTSRAHQMMVSGALRNMNHDEYYLDDGNAPREA